MATVKVPYSDIEFDPMDDESVIAALTSLHDMRDFERAHSQADEILCLVMEARGMERIVEAWGGVGKWYA